MALKVNNKILKTMRYIVNAARNKGMYERFSTFFAKIFPYPPDIVQIK